MLLLQMCVKITRGLYHVPERRYFNFGPGRFSEIVAILTVLAVAFFLIKFIPLKRLMVYLITVHLPSEA